MGRTIGRTEEEREKENKRNEERYRETERKEKRKSRVLVELIQISGGLGDGGSAEKPSRRMLFW